MRAKNSANSEWTMCLLACLAVGMLAMVPRVALAGTSSGLGTTSPPVRDVVINADLACAISLTIAASDPADLGPGQTPLSSGVGFVDDTGPDQDTIDFGNVNLLGATYVLANGGDAYLNAGDSSVNIIGALQVTIAHTCTVAPTATVEATGTGVGGVTVRWDASHNGLGWETSNYTELAAPVAFVFGAGEVPVDVGFNAPLATPSATLSSTVTFTTIGGS